MRILLVLLNVVFVCTLPQNSTLKLVHVFFRHGSRIPDEHELYPNHERYESYKHIGFGQLTNAGKLRSYQLGKVLRNRYNDFLGEDFESNAAFIQSTNIERTKMTAMLLLAGLFPPSKRDKWNEKLNWIPIPLSLDQGDYDLWKPIYYCPTYLREMTRVLESQEAEELKQQYKHVFELATHKTGKAYNTMRDIFLLHQLIHVEQTMNATLPDWAVESFSDLRHIAIMQCYFENKNTLMKRLAGGRMLSKVMEHMKDKIQNTLNPPGRKIFLYSGHDYNIVNTLASLNLYNKLHFPNFNAAVCIELHQEPSTLAYFVKVFYLKDVFDEPEAQFIPECGYMCEFSKFQEILMPYLPINYTKECESVINLD
ncbi:hypothetical protein PPYR_07339 [Photinus pyralis]|uniref:acid phosphatase n=1 Tax=Photinus pyralis TaxID=7054 RepID=A0A1Y1N416_PHOPY|nr:venom acid phosphatase Acph-1-like [Photinus pyralis]XP_031338919.1 venom acid phosphatase Acph-1-like [Photinus pyralis]XP_031338920.1 venom acid phosphatase Acph-1-like [Photinus pyralis]KAB0799459.1 hypothetical protein PPYR_07339 [Photinus pyralis]